MKDKFNAEKALYVACALLTVIFIGFTVRKYTAVKTFNITNIDQNNKSEKITVNIAGAVKNSGEFKLYKGDTVGDAIYAAGGVADEADLSDVDIEEVLYESCTVNIPERSGNSVIDANESKEKGSDSKVVYNINTATKEELCMLPGIGENMAESIIKYREENGNFSSVEEIMNVGGIGAKKFEKMRSYITV